MWNLISHFLTFAGGMASGVMLMCLIQTGKLAVSYTHLTLPTNSRV